MKTAQPIFSIKPEHGEGPIWCPIHQVFYCVDLLQGKYYKIDWKTSVVDEFSVGQELGVMALTDHDRIVVAVRDGFGFFDENNKTLSLIEHSPEYENKNTRMNDGAVDPKGRFFAGTMEYDGANDVGKLYRLNQDLSWDQMEDGLFITNGMGWSPDATTYFMIDTFRNVMYAYDYDVQTGSLSNRRVHIQWKADEYPDGMAIDADGGFWVAMWMGSKVSYYSRDGQWVEDIHIPVLHTTSCCFGGPDLKTLLITTSQLNLSEAERLENPLAGRVFSIEAGVQGQIEPRFKE